MNKDATLFRHFGELTDPRIDRTKKYSLIEIIIITICAIISGAETWNDIEEYGESK